MKNRTRYTAKTVRLLSLPALVALAGCMSLGRGEPAQQHYVLGGSEAPVGATVSPELTGLTVGVRRLDLAAYLETPFILVRRGSNRLGYSEFHRWGEGLAGGINRTVAGYLGDRSPLRGVDVAPWPAGERYDYVIQLHVLRFEGLVPEGVEEVDGEVHMLATWEIIQQLDGVVLARGTTDYLGDGWTLGDYAGLVTLLDAGLQVLTEELLESLRSLAPAR
jgi:hypothetical protein